MPLDKTKLALITTGNDETNVFPKFGYVMNKNSLKNIYDFPCTWLKVRTIFPLIKSQ